MVFDEDAFEKAYLSDRLYLLADAFEQEQEILNNLVSLDENGQLLNINIHATGELHGDNTEWSEPRSYISPIFDEDRQIGIGNLGERSTQGESSI